MYTRSIIQDRDKTTSNGNIQARYNGLTSGEPPRNICFEGDPVICPKCKMTGTTKCIPPFRPNTGHDGRQINLDGDLCICKCSPPPRLKASNNAHTVDFGNHEITGMPGSSNWLAYAGYTTAPELTPSYGKIFEFKDSETGKILANRTFIVNDNGSIRKSKTDNNGKAIIETLPGHAISIHLVFESPQGEMNYEI